jgi:hypothetical protein
VGRLYTRQQNFGDAMSGQRAQNSQISHEEAELARYKIEQLASTIKILIVAVSVMVVTWLLQRALVDISLNLAGKVTDANIVMTLLSKTQFNFVVTFGVSGFGIAYGLLQRRLKEDTVKRLHARIAQLEERLDAKRSSSQLTKSGRTNPKDR